MRLITPRRRIDGLAIRLCLITHATPGIGRNYVQVQPLPDTAQRTLYARILSITAALPDRKMRRLVLEEAKFLIPDLTDVLILIGLPNRVHRFRPTQ